MLPIIEQAPTRRHVNVVYAGEILNTITLNQLQKEFEVVNRLPLSHLTEFLQDQSFLSLPDVILIEADADGDYFKIINSIKKNPLWNNVIIVLLSHDGNEVHKENALRLKLHDHYVYPFPLENLTERLNFLVKFRITKPILEDLQDGDLIYKTPASKRLFDLIISISALIMISPLLLLIALVIKLDSKGPVIYKSKRVGTGYKIFDFYKFRSMRVDADKQLEELSELNQYNFPDKKNNNSAVFVKIKNDPRVTKVGRFLRNTSLDELPQLFNVIRGEMSIVGNRPLPLYEAELLTSNEWSMRFLGPAGVTGLWQISKRGNKTVSATERKRLDNFYATKYSFRMDLMILLKTMPALFQKENV